MNSDVCFLMWFQFCSKWCSTDWTQQLWRLRIRFNAHDFCSSRVSPFQSNYQLTFPGRRPEVKIRRLANQAEKTGSGQGRTATRTKEPAAAVQASSQKQKGQGCHFAKSVLINQCDQSDLWWRLIDPEASQLWILERENSVFHPGQIFSGRAPLVANSQNKSGWRNKSE